MNVIPALWIVALFGIGGGSYRGIFAADRKRALTGWLMFAAGLALMLFTLLLVASDTR